MDRSDGLNALQALRAWYADLSSRFSPKVARQIITVTCLTYQAFATWKRRAPFTEAQVRRRLAALQHIEHRALSECEMTIYATFVSSFELRSLPPKSPLWKFLGIRSMLAQTQRWPVIQFEHKSTEWRARWNPARRLLISCEGQSQVLSAMELPDVRSIYPDLPKTTRDERIERSTPKELCINAYTANPLKNFRSILAYAAHLQKISIDISSASINVDALAGVEFPKLEELRLRDLGWCIPRAGQLAPFDQSPRLSKLSGELTSTKLGDLLACLLHKSWWQRLESLTVSMKTGEKSPSAPILAWLDCEVPLIKLNVSECTLDHALDLLKARFPRLKSLALRGIELSDEYLSVLVQSSLPQLEDLDLRGTRISREAFQKLAPKICQAFPRLERIGLQFIDGEEPCYDWGGGVAESYSPIFMSNEALESNFLVPIGKRLLTDPQ